MSRAPQQMRPGARPGPPNGYSSQASSRYASEERGGTPNGVSPGISRERRAGGYGGFFEGNGDTLQPQQYAARSRPSDYGQMADGSSRQRSNDSSRDVSNHRPAERERSRGTPSRRIGTKQIEEVLQRIQQEWDFMMGDECIPVQVALQLMDSSSLGRAHQYGRFQDIHKQLQRALRAIVNEHHQGFNSSIGTFHKIQSSISNSQNRVRVLRDSLGQAKSNLSASNPELRELANSSQVYDEMLSILGQIEQLQLVPEKLEARISEKRFLTAVDILHQGLKLVRKPEMQEIGALTDLRIYLTNQETSLTDILIEELHNHLYLKSPYCQDRWKPTTQDQRNGSATEEDGHYQVVSAGRPVYLFLESLSTDTPMADDASRNPEVDTFYYIQLLVESLFKIGRLDFAVDSIEQRLPVELYRVVDKTSNDVDRRHPTTVRRELHDKRKRSPADFDQSETQTKTISDFLQTLYAKFEAIAEGHRVLHDVIQGVVKRENLRNAGSLAGGFKELWKLYQSELRSLLHDYLATDGDVGRRSSQNQGIGFNRFQRSYRDKSKRIFKFADMDSASSEFASEQDDLDAILKSSVPGLVSSSRRTAENLMSRGNNNNDGSASGHKLLIEPSVFNMGLLLPPSLAFINRLKGVVPPSSDIAISTLTSFLDDFLVNVFHPQLDETLAELSAETFIDLDAFQEDPAWSTMSRKPIFKGTSAFFSLVTLFCKMLGTIPHDQAFSQLIITHMVTYHEKCLGWYKSLVTRAQASSAQGIRLKAAAAFAESGEVHDSMVRLLAAEETDKETLISKENGLLLLSTSESPLQSADVISDRKSINSLCLLHTSMDWLARKVGELRHFTSNELDSSRRDRSSKQRRRWTHFGPSRGYDVENRARLPMNQETLLTFDGVVASYHDLALMALLTLHTEIRCQTIVSLSHSIQSNYNLREPINEADEGILSFNEGLVNFDEDITKHLCDHEQLFMKRGIAALVDSLLLSLATSPVAPNSPQFQTPMSPTPGSGPGASKSSRPHLQAMNRHGADRMQLNILVLQQNLRNIEQDRGRVSLSHSARFFDLFTAGADEVVEKVKQKAAQRSTTDEDLDFSYDEFKALVELCYSENLTSEKREVALQAKRQLSDHLLVLSEHLWQS